jgi:hypothetical protein
MSDLQSSYSPILRARFCDGATISRLDSNSMCASTKGNKTTDSIGVIDGISCEGSEVVIFNSINLYSCNQSTFTSCALHANHIADRHYARLSQCEC